MTTDENRAVDCGFPVIDEFGAEIVTPASTLNQAHIVMVRLASGWIHRMDSRRIKDMPKEDKVTLVVILDVLIDYTELYDPSYNRH
jgi:hypothetical protein